MTKTSGLGDALRKLNRLVILDRRDVGTIYFFAIIAGIISLILPLGIQTIISFVMAAQLSTSIVVLITLVIVAVAINGIIQLKQIQVIERIRQKIFTRYSLECIDTVPKMQLEKVDDYFLPELVNRFFDIINLSKSIEKIMLDIPTAVMQILLGLLLIAFYHPVFIAFGAIVLIVLVVILKVTSNEGFATSMAASERKYEIAGWLQEVARGIHTFKYNKGTDLHIKKTDSILSTYLKQRTSHFKILETQFKSLVAFKVLIISAMLIVGTYLLLNQQINVGQFIAADIVIILIVNSIEKLIENMDNVYSCLTSLEKLSKIVDRDTEVSGNLLYNKADGSNITFNDVSYTYPDGSEALQNINIDVPNGSIVLIRGGSGSGKSSLLRLLSGSYNNFSGSININNIPIGNYDTKSLRSSTGILLQQQNIFEGTLLDNITMGHNEIPMSEIVFLSRLLGLEHFVAHEKKGFDTPLTPTGTRLRAEVKHQILLMRALVSNPSLLLLESPFKYVEDEKADQIMDYIKSKGITTVITTEKKGWEEIADQVFLLDDGTSTKMK